MYGKHKYTKDPQLAHRCFEALYMSVLLEDGFGFHGDSRDITLALEVLELLTPAFVISVSKSLKFSDDIM